MTQDLRIRFQVVQALKSLDEILPDNAVLHGPTVKEVGVIAQGKSHLLAENAILECSCSLPAFHRYPSVFVAVIVCSHIHGIQPLQSRL